MRLFLALIIFLVSAQTALAGSEPPFAFPASLRLFWGLLIVLGILLVIYAFIKRKMSFLTAGGGKGVITIVEMRHLMPRKSLCLVKVRGHEYLLGLGNDQVNLIAAIPPLSAQTDESAGSKDFSATLTAATSATNNHDRTL